MKFLILLSSLFCSQAFAQTAAVVNIDLFQLNRAWTWTYYDSANVFYSTERYQVMNIKGSVVTLEMASTFKQNTPLRAHHRLVVDINKCLNAYSTPGKKKPWGFAMYYWTGQNWDSVGNPPTTFAFEEKFNCNPNYVTGHREFFNSGENAAVLARKSSSEKDPEEAFLLLFEGTSKINAPTPKFH